MSLSVKFYMVTSTMVPTSIPLKGEVLYSDQNLIHGGSPGISPQKNDFSPPRIFTIKIYINEISYIIYYSNGDKEQYREGKVETIANSKMINSNKFY